MLCTTSLHKFSFNALYYYSFNNDEPCFDGRPGHDVLDFLDEALYPAAAEVWVDERYAAARPLMQRRWMSPSRTKKQVQDSQTRWLV